MKILMTAKKKKCTGVTRGDSKSSPGAVDTGRGFQNGPTASHTEDARKSDLVLGPFFPHAQENEGISTSSMLTVTYLHNVML